jgi:membrane-bound lytic murein transglycosylase B
MNPHPRAIRVTSCSRRQTLLLVLTALPVLLALPARGATESPASGYATRADVKAFIAGLATNDGFDAATLRKVFAQIRAQPSVIAAMSRPLVAPPAWFDYAPRFVSPARIDGGLAFWQANAVALARAENEFGVPTEVIVAIIGVETFYGRNTGSYRVIDALTTLAFDYPRRAEFFAGELRHFLLLTREQGVSPLLPRGSFAGAMGLPQFMPGSIRAYALDYGGDGRVDLATDPVDAIGSVANYLARHGWQPGQPVMEAVRVEGEKRDAMLSTLDGGMAERRALGEWVNGGVTGFAIPGDIAADPVGLLMLEERDALTYWVVFNNWYVLTRYNRSRLYASAVWQLALALKDARVQAMPGR